MPYRVLVVAASAGGVRGVGDVVKPTLLYRVLVVVGSAGGVRGVDDVVKLTLP